MSKEDTVLDDPKWPSQLDSSDSESDIVASSMSQSIDWKLCVLCQSTTSKIWYVLHVLTVQVTLVLDMHCCFQSKKVSQDRLEELVLGEE